MTHYEDYEYSPEDVEFSEILEDLLLMQSRMRTGNDTESTSIPYEHYRTVHRLNELCRGRQITANSGQLLTPIKDDRGNVVAMSPCYGSATGVFEGIAVNMDENGKPVIGLQILLETTGTDSPVHRSNTSTYAFAPLDSSNFILDIDIADILPEKDDPIAEDIDTYLLDETIDLQSLTTLFQDVIYPMGELQRDMYMRYLNKIATFDRITAITSIGLSMEDDGASIYQGLDGSYCADGVFDGFTLVNCENGEGDYSPKLIALFIDEDGDEMGVFVDDIQAIQLR